MSSIWRISPAAFFLSILMFCGGLGIGIWIGSWILPLVVALTHGGWTEVCRIPISERIFADVPAFLDEHSVGYKVVDFGRIIFCLAGTTIFGLLGRRWWEYLVIEKYKWMTRQEVEEFYKRDPGI
jgi:hypothetical protein